jgi:hypothetical protein
MGLLASVVQLEAITRVTLTHRVAPGRSGRRIRRLEGQIVAASGIFIRVSDRQAFSFRQASL